MIHSGTKPIHQYFNLHPKSKETWKQLEDDAIYQSTDDMMDTHNGEPHSILTQLSGANQLLLIETLYGWVNSKGF